MIMSPDGARNREWLLWRRPPANYCSIQLSVMSPALLHALSFTDVSRDIGHAPTRAETTELSLSDQPLLDTHFLTDMITFQLWHLLFMEAKFR
jgi:hypothetical protein